MASRKPAIINGTFKEVDSNAKVADVVSPNVVSITTPNGVVHRQDFNRCPVPDQYNTNLTPMDKGYDKRRLLVAECEQIQRFLNEFTPPVNGESRKVSIVGNEAFVRIDNFLLPKGLDHDSVDFMLDILESYPHRSPHAADVRRTDTNENVLLQMHQAYEGCVYDEAPYKGQSNTWINLRKQESPWKFDFSDPFEGDCLWKFIEGMYQTLEAHVQGGK